MFRTECAGALECGSECVDGLFGVRARWEDWSVSVTLTRVPSVVAYSTASQRQHDTAQSTFLLRTFDSTRTEKTMG